MFDNEIHEFTKSFDLACQVLSKGAYTPNPQASLLIFRALQGYPLGIVLAAIDAHVKDPVRGRYAPVPADLIAQIERYSTPDSRPGVEEAWAMIPGDESQTVVWTTEMAEAYGICSSLLVRGDHVAARMAFKEAYTRLTTLARAHGRPVVWDASLGHDVEQRKRALNAAVDAGRLTHEAASAAYPAISAPKAAALLPAPEGSKGKAAEIRKTILALAQQKRADPVDPLKWAKDLRTADRGGLQLTAAQKTAWREALDQAPAQAVSIDNFRPISNDLLPPGMRK